MKNFLAGLIFTITAILTLTDPLAAIAQKREGKAGKEPAIETKQLPPEQAELLLKEFKERESPGAW
jgi:hypothetical protein